MRKILFTLALLTFLAYSSAIFAAPFSNEPNGFNGLQWGTSIEDLKDNMIYLGTSGKTAYYYKKNETFCIDGAELNIINYGFKDGILVCVGIIFKSFESYLAVQDYLTDCYGKGVLVGRNINGRVIYESTAWFGDGFTIILGKNSLWYEGRK